MHFTLGAAYFSLEGWSFAVQSYERFHTLFGLGVDQMMPKGISDEIGIGLDIQ